ncbi:MAG: ABC transporter ATP-binding protein [Lachnospiraceae bacterium]|nr:ABC transporter ATP-binding protein [Lachnospiraceae bacterium]
MKTKAVVKIKDLKKRFKGFELDIRELEIPKGFATALIGENGAGKSTLLNILAGVRLDYKGEVTYYNGSLTDEEVREVNGYVAASNYFLPHWTVEAVAELNELLFENFDKGKYESLCKDLGIWESKKKSVSKLSDGMKMKTMLASVFARETNMLLLDEPASPLDPLMRDELCSMIRNYIDEGDGDKTVFFSTHNVADMENVTDYAMIMEQGKIVEQGFVEDLKAKYILVKGEKEDADKLQGILVGFQKNSYGCEGLCLSENLNQLAGFDVATETPNLSQICVAVMKQYSKLKKAV